MNVLKLYVNVSLTNVSNFDLENELKLKCTTMSAFFCKIYNKKYYAILHATREVVLYN